MNEQPVFRELADKVNAILGSPEPETVLKAIRALAEGDAAELDDGTTIEPLSDLRPQPVDPTSQLLYQQTMAALLRWGLRAFPQQPTRQEPSLWESMAILDGARGYNQQLVNTKDSWYDDMSNRVEPLPEEVVCDPGMLPMLPEVAQGRVRPLEDDFSYLENLLRRDRTVRTVVATRCPFGWRNLWIECVCLVVDADETAPVLAALPTQATPIIVITAQINDMADHLADAEQVLGLTGLDRVDSSQRRFVLRENTMLRPVQQSRHLVHGQSISLKGDESKGSVGVFLSPASNTDDPPAKYALTAYHVVPFSEKEETRAITPGGLDILSELLRATFRADTQQSARLLASWREPCGTVEHGDIGVNEQGWRTDLALVRLAEGWQGKNGQWFEDAMPDFAAGTEGALPPPTIFDPHRVVGATDPEAGAILYKDGAGSERTAGRVGPFESKMFRARSADASSDHSDPTVVVARLLTFHPLRKHAKPVCAPGDSGAGVFMPDYAAGGWQWAGQLVNRWHEGPWPVGLFVPSSGVLQSLRETTGMEWRLTE
ncbi:hypothetical protein ASPZODRAFT_28750 [Penicilliopsis zonata CBS 506.65]|uniref:Uncharacterized protein n=1 Tax=Penicilliopsis zonata CBS 506.65 TaxID=1073090 RepID=A0A1L9S6V1_9EURO|nr:hypothetical protein ASPZODRAFT_28750 [Penicilliopsis zonata CBS 506.65]OJJ42891.1 hypothetical protein ASPZODRAFT_28750 [Penicilliopsis zonata CBS 506.65]